MAGLRLGKVGSSREGLPVAELVKKHLSDFADCKIWNEDVFEFGKSYFETLMELLSLFEYGVLVGLSGLQRETF